MFNKKYYWTSISIIHVHSVDENCAVEARDGWGDYTLSFSSPAGSTDWWNCPATYESSFSVGERATITTFDCGSLENREFARECTSVHGKYATSSSHFSHWRSTTTTKSQCSAAPRAIWVSRPVLVSRPHPLIPVNHVCALCTLGHLESMCMCVCMCVYLFYGGWCWESLVTTLLYICGCLPSCLGLGLVILHQCELLRSFCPYLGALLTVTTGESSP